ncbi:peptidoglycan DD-metalloendopeptidase family protein [Halanaerobaculum tunisiense]
MKEQLKRVLAKLKEAKWKKGLAFIGLFFTLGAMFALYQHYSEYSLQRSQNQESAQVEVIEPKEKASQPDFEGRELSLPAADKSTKQEQSKKETTQQQTATSEEKPQDAIKVTSQSQIGNLLPPVEGEVVTAREWYKDQTLDAWKYNPGMDLAAEIGTEVKAAQAGQVKEIIRDDFVGLTVIIKHNDNFKTLYGNLQSTDLTEEDQVSKGQLIGKVGDSGGSGKNSFHFEVIKDGKNVAPEKYLN